jgi:hypothetical protein
MAWDFDFEPDDSFFPPSFVGTAVSTDAPSLFETPAKPTRQTADRGSRALAEENDELRRTEVSLTEKFVQISSLNERLKQQMDECRDRFRSAVFAGFRASNK